MLTLPTGQRSFVPTEALARAVAFDNGMMHVSLTDSRVISTSVVSAFISSHAVATRMLSNWCRRAWLVAGDELDEEGCVAGLITGADWRSA